MRLRQQSQSIIRAEERRKELIAFFKKVLDEICFRCKYNEWMKGFRTCERKYKTDFEESEAQSETVYNNGSWFDVDDPNGWWVPGDASVCSP
jgi:hypothetical protein